MKLLIPLIPLALLPQVALAHGEHGHSLTSNLYHLLSTAEHLWPLGVGLGIVLVLVVIKRARSKAK